MVKLIPLTAIDPFLPHNGRDLRQCDLQARIRFCKIDDAGGAIDVTLHEMSSPGAHRRRERARD